MSFSRGLIARTASVDTTPPNTIRALPGVFRLDGQDAAMSPPVVRAPISLTAGTGSFTFIGEDMTPVTGYMLSVDAGSFTLAGQDANLKKTAASSGITPVARYANTGDVSFAGPTYDGTAIPIGAADPHRIVVFFIYDDAARGAGGYTVTVNRLGTPIIATQIRKNDSSVLCYANVPTGTTCDIRISADGGSGFGIMAISVVTLITSTHAPVSSSQILAPSYTAEPILLDASITIPTNGCGVEFLAVPRGANDCRPGIFVGGGFADVSTLSAYYSVGNGCNIVGALSTTAGTSNPAVSGSGAGFGFSKANMAAAAWGP